MRLVIRVAGTTVAVVALSEAHEAMVIWKQTPRSHIYVEQ